MGAAWVPCQSLTLSLGLGGRVFWVLCLILASWGPGGAGIQVFLYRLRILLTSVCVGGATMKAGVLGRQNSFFVQNLLGTDYEYTSLFYTRDKHISFPGGVKSTFYIFYYSLQSLHFTKSNVFICIK